MRSQDLPTKTCDALTARRNLTRSDIDEPPTDADLDRILEAGRRSRFGVEPPELGLRCGHR